MEKILRCMAFKKRDLYVAVCLDLTLAAQADSMAEAKSKLESQIIDYLEEAVSEKEYMEDLLNRKAPYSWWVRYNATKLILSIASIFKRNEESEKNHQIFEENSSCCRAGS